MATRMDFLIQARDRASRVMRSVGDAGQRMGTRLRDGARVGSRGVDDNLNRTDRRMNQFVRDTNGRLRDMRGKFVSESRLAGLGLSNGIGIGARRARKEVDRLRDVLDGIRIAKVIAMKTAFLALGAQAVPVIAAMVAGLANIAPAALIAIPAIVGLIAVSKTLKLATHGVADAFSAAWEGDAEAFAKALKELSPQARQFVREGVKMIPLLKGIRRAVQDTFFAKIPDGSLTRVAKNLLPAMKVGLDGIAASAGRASSRLLKFMQTAQAKTDLGRTFAGIAGALRPLERVPATLLKMLGRVSAVAAPFLERFAARFANAIDGLMSKIHHSSKDGGLAEMIQGALDTLSQLGRIAGNVGSTISAMFRSAGGGDLLDSIERITKAVADFANSERGQQILGKVLAAIAAAGPVILVASALTSVITGIASAIAAVAASQGVALVVAGIIAIAAGLAYLYTKVAPAREILVALGAKLAEFGQAIWVKLLPALQRAGEVIQANLVRAFEWLKGVIEDNKPELEQLFQLLKKVGEFVAKYLVPVLAGLLIVAIYAVVGAVAGLITIWSGLVKAFHAVKDAVMVVWPLVVSAFKAIERGVSGAIGGTIAFLKSLPAKAKAAVGDLGGALFNAGKSLIQGLINGVMDRVGSLKSTLGGITDMLPDWKGPMERDKRLLEPSGRALMGGLMAGIASQVAPLRTQLQGITTDVAAAGGPVMSKAGPSAAGAGSDGGGAAGGVTRHEFVFSSTDPLLDAFFKGARFRVATRHGGNVQRAFGT